MRIERLVCGAIFVLAAVLLASGALAEETKQKGEETAKADKEVPAVITTDWLHERYGKEVSEDTGEAPKTPDKPTAEGEKPAGEQATTAGSAGEKPEMTPEKRKTRIAEIEAELQRLDKRILGLKNPLLRGTYPATAEEREAETGKSNPERIAMVEQRKTELKQELAELRSQ